MEERVATEVKAAEAEEARLTEEVRIAEEEQVEAERKSKEVEKERQAAMVLAEYQQKGGREGSILKVRGCEHGTSQGIGKGVEGDQGKEGSGRVGRVKEGGRVKETQLGLADRNYGDRQIVSDGAWYPMDGEGGDHI